MTPCYNQDMKRLWPLSIVLLLALPLAAQQGDEAAPAADAAPAEDAPADGPAAQEPPPAAEAQPSEPADESAKPDPAENTDAGDGAAPSKEEPLVSVKLVAPPSEESDEESVAPLAAKVKVVPTATLMKPAKKGKKAAKGSKIAKAKKSLTPPVVVAAKPVVAPEPPPPAIPAVPLTPITPRNP